MAVQSGWGIGLWGAALLIGGGSVGGGCEGGEGRLDRALMSIGMPTGDLSVGPLAEITGIAVEDAARLYLNDIGIVDPGDLLPDLDDPIGVIAGGLEQPAAVLSRVPEGPAVQIYWPGAVYRFYVSRIVNVEHAKLVAGPFWIVGAHDTAGCALESDGCGLCQDQSGSSWAFCVPN